MPFAAQMQFNRLNCGGEKRIQLLLNDANFDLSPTGCTSDEYGTCSMSDFVATKNVQNALPITDGDATWRSVCSA